MNRAVRTRARVLGTMAIVLMYTQSASAGGTLRVQGEETALISHSFEVTQPVDIELHTPTGSPVSQTFVVQKALDEISPRLVEALVRGESLQVRATINGSVDGTTQPVTTYDLVDARIANIRHLGSSANPTEVVSFIFRSITIRDEASGASFTYDPRLP